MEIKKFGSVYCCGQTMVPGACIDDNRIISIGDTTPGFELQWIKAGNLLVADRCACIGTSWETLDYMGYIFGTTVKIDGELYTCRSLKVGSDESTKNEWDDLLKEYGNDDNLWHWIGEMFWGQETPAHRPLERVTRGGQSARAWLRTYKGDQSVFVGFRPVLEALFPPPLDLDPFIGKKVCAYGPQGTVIEGILTEFDEYDLLIDGVPHLPDGCVWATVDGRSITVNRNSVLHLR